MIKGLDASSVQGKLNVDALDAYGVRFLIHKCQQGNDGKDPWYERNIAAAQAKGWTVGAYHFMYPIPKLDPVRQAEGFYAASQVGAYNGELPPSLDLEWPDPDAGFAKWGCTPASVSLFARRCAERTAELFGRKPIIYIYPYFAQKLGAADISWLADYPLWIASYGTKTPLIPKPWQSWTLWQYDGNGGEKMPGGGDADFNWFNGDDEALEAFCQVAAASPPVSGTYPHESPTYVEIDGSRIARQT